MERRTLQRRHAKGIVVIALVLLASLTTITSLSAPASASAGRYVVVDTGQSKCYDNFEEVPCPGFGEAFYGQDAQYSGNQPAYRDNGDGTVTDLSTGLMWVKSPGDKVTYAQAVAGAAACRVGGYSDWRLPTIKELYSLILFSGTDVSPCMNGGACPNAVPFLDTNYFDFKYGDADAGERIIDAQYWSSTAYVGSTMNGVATVFGVNFADGRIKGYPRDMGPRGTANTQFVRYVRGNTNFGINDFQDNGDGTITDKGTGLMWSQADSGTGMNWEAALAWVQTKNSQDYLGHNDWRLPNAKELQSLVDYTRSPDTTSSAAINPLFTCTKIINEAKQADYPFYWTGTTHASSDDSRGAAVYIAFGRAMGYMNGAWIDVHGAGAQRSDPKGGNPADYPTGRGPQGDAIRIYNYVRLVRDSGVSTTSTATTAATTAGTTVIQTSTVISTTMACTIVTKATTATIEGLQMQVVSNSSVSGLVFDSTKGLLNFVVSGPEGSQGFFDVTIAKILLSGQPVVMIDGVEHTASVSEDASFWYVHVTYPHSEHHVTIGGSETIPEFSVTASILFILLVSAASILLRSASFRRNDRRPSNQNDR